MLTAKAVEGRRAGCNEAGGDVNWKGGGHGEGGEGGGVGSVAHALACAGVGV
jgi:hypothetical protein